MLRISRLRRAVVGTVQFLRPFVESKEPKTCPIHNISDVYSSTPETLTGAYEQGGNDKWFFFATKKYHDVTSRDVRVTTDGGGHWIRKGAIKKFFDQNNTLLGFKRTQDFYAQGMDLAYWRMEELSLRTESYHVLAKIYAIPGTQKQKLKSVPIESTAPPTKKLKQDDITPQTGNEGGIPRLPAQQTETDLQSPTADEDFVYHAEQERREWMKDTFLNPLDQ